MKSKKLSSLLFFASFWLGAGLLAQTESLSLAPIMDATVSEASPDNNYGTSNLALGRTSGQAWESYLRFDLGSIPAGSVIESVELRLRSGSTALGPIRVEQVSAPWTEGGLTWGTKPAGTLLFEGSLDMSGTTGDLTFPQAAYTYLQDIVNGVATDRGLALSLPSAGAEEFLALMAR